MNVVGAAYEPTPISPPRSGSGPRFRALVYTAAYADMIGRASGQKIDSSKSIYPNVADGVDGMNFLTQCVASSKQGGAWLSLKHPLCRR